MTLKNTLICILLSVFSFCLSAQENKPIGSIRGIVTDVVSGQTLPSVTITIPDSNPVIGTTTDNDGRFHLNNLPVGRYVIHASFIGYEPAVFRELNVEEASRYAGGFDDPARLIWVF